MKITQEVIDAVEETRWSEDDKQDFYVWLLENDNELLEAVELEGKKAITKLCNRFLAFRMRNKRWVDNNRERIIAENKDLLRAMYVTGVGQAADSPEDILMFGEDFDERLEGLTELNKYTLERIYLDGLTPEELAAEEGVERNAIDQRVHNIKRQLRGETQ